MKKTKQIGFCLLSAMTLGQMKTPLSAKEIRFMINGTEIQKRYHDEAWLSFEVKESEKNSVKLYVKDDNIKKQQITDIQWMKKEDMWIGQVEVLDGDELQYELYIEDEYYQTPTFSKDTIPCSMKLLENDEEVGVLQDTYQKDTSITFQFSDLHMQQVIASIRKDGKPVSLDWRKQNEQLDLQLTNGTYDIRLDMIDEYGNQAIYEKKVLVDDSLPLLSVLVNKEPYAQQVLDQSEEVEILVSEDHLDISNSFILLDGELTPITWESDGNIHKTTFLFTEEGSHTISCVIRDLAGNTVEKEYVVAIDQTAPNVILQEQDEAINEIKQVYDHHFQLQMKVEEEYLNLMESYVSIDGEKKILHEVRDVYEYVFEDGAHEFSYHLVDLAGHVSEIEPISFLVDSTAPLIDADTARYQRESVRIPLKIEEDNLKELFVSCHKDQFQYDIEVDWTKDDQSCHSLLVFEEEGAYELEITAVDEAENRTIRKLAFVIDKTAPVVKVQDSSQGNLYLNHANQLRLNAADLYLDHAHSQIQIYKNQKLMDTQNLGHDMWNFQASEDGDYQVNWTIQDMAGNRTSGKNHFVIDQAAPVVKLQATTNSITNTIPSILVEIHDDNLKEYELLVSEFQETIRWKWKDGMPHVVTLPDHGFADYSISLYAVDHAGNEIKTAPSHLIYDPNSPILTASIQDTALKEGIPFITNKDIAIHMEAYDEQIVACHYELYENGILLSSESSMNDIGLRQKMEESHAYQLIMVAYDLAGNRSEKRFDIVIDREKPVWKIKGTDHEQPSFSKEWVPELTKDGKDVQIVRCILKKNGKEIPYKWKQPIEEEGDYELILQVRDKAMNKWEMDPIVFSIDHSAPWIRLYDVKHNWYIEDKASVGSSLCIYLDQVDRNKRKQEHFSEIWINGSQLDVSNVQYDENDIPYVLVPVDDTFKIMVKAIDDAGNEQVFEKTIEVVKEEHLKETMEEKRIEPVVNTLMLSEKEAEGDELMWIILSSLLLAFGCLWYGTRKHRNHHSES